MRLLPFFLLSSGLCAQSGFPFSDETLHYAVLWPGGISLGEGTMTARQTSGQWKFELSLEANVSAFSIADKFRSVANDRCSLEFEKDFVHGPKKSRETMEFNGETGVAKRTTKSGGSSELQVGSCARDALAFLYFARRELGQGRVPPAETVYYGGPYEIRMQYTGPQTVKDAVADRVMVTIRGKSSNHTVEMLFARDAARTPVAIRVPFVLGTFSMELVK